MEYDKADNFTFDEAVSSAVQMQYIAHEVVFVLFAVVGICADVAIIYTILRFKRMHSMESTFIVNWAIADLLSLIIAPSGYRIISILDNLPLPPEFMCIVFQLGSALHATVVLFVIVISIDWLLGAYFEKASVKFRNYYKYVIGSIWVFSILTCGFSSGFCLDDDYIFFSGFLLLSSSCAILLIIIVLQSSRAVRKYLIKKPLDHPTLTLTLTTAFVLTWFLAILTLIIFDIGRVHPLLGIISECALFCSSIVNLILLYRLNTDFQACLLQVFKRSSNKYEESICNFDNPIVKIVRDKSSTDISFHNPNEELLTNVY